MQVWCNVTVTDLYNFTYRLWTHVGDAIRMNDQVG